MIDWLLLPFLVGVLVCLTAAPLGSMVVWRKMSYLGETLSHGGILGVALGFVWQMDVSLSTTLVSVLSACLLAFLQGFRYIGSDALLGIMAHVLMSLGLIAVSLLGNVRVDLMAYLFGDLLMVNWSDFYGLSLVTVIVLSFIGWNWRGLLSMTINEELAAAEGVPVKRLRFFLILMIALVVAGAMKVVGVMLMTALLIIPASAARFWSDTPEKMVVIGLAISLFSLMIGLVVSWHVDVPVGPAIVSTTGVFVLLGMMRVKFSDAF